MSAPRRQMLLAGVVAGLLLPGTALSQGCYFSDLEWAPGDGQLRFLAGSGEDLRTLQVDVASGAIACLDARVHDPRWAGARARVLFHDLFGIFEIAPEESAPRMLLFLPDLSSLFLRDYGADARGRLLVWTYERRLGEHAIWMQSTTTWDRVPGQLTGPEALRLWDQRNASRSFRRVGGQFVRSTCVRRPRRKDKLCLENLMGATGRSPLFRMTMGAPGGIEVLQNRCAPAGVSPSPDSSRVVVGLFEEVDDGGRSEVLSAWVANWDGATRVYETLLPGLRDVRRRQETSAYWVDRRNLLWADAAGQLFQLRTDPPGAQTVVGAVATPVRSSIYRVIAAEVGSVEAARDAAARLGEAGLDAGIFDLQAAFEVQVGGGYAREEAQRRAEGLRRSGFPDARVRSGRVEELAVEMGFAWTPTGSGAGAFVRHLRGANGIYSEIWFVEDGAQPRLLVPRFDEFTPFTASR
ncbi:MAG: SPOR domain-containing protein [Candidatus Latescibacterota bacterium]|nr:MAG: SPOR domain-containing protein [Candidatus Latescibacterota bacterium]